MVCYYNSHKREAHNLGPYFSILRTFDFDGNIARFPPVAPIAKTNGRAIIGGMSKATDTKVQILDSALGLARSIGYEALSIGELAKKVGMSKSGLFAHFKSKEALQLMILDHAAFTFTQKVIRPALKKKRGIIRLKAIIDHWVDWSVKENRGSCPLVTAAIEFDDRPGEVQEKIKTHLSSLHHTIARACEIAVEEKELAEDTDPDLMAQEIFSYILSYHLYVKTMCDAKAGKRFRTSLEQLIERNLA